MGDGILAYFGYPRAHENSAERAILAGLKVVDAVTALEPMPGPQVGRARRNRHRTGRGRRHHRPRMGVRTERRRRRAQSRRAAAEPRDAQLGDHRTGDASPRQRPVRLRGPGRARAEGNRQAGAHLARHRRAARGEPVPGRARGPADAARRTRRRVQSAARPLAEGRRRTGPGARHRRRGRHRQVATGARHHRRKARRQRRLGDRAAVLAVPQAERAVSGGGPVAPGHPGRRAQPRRRVALVGHRGLSAHNVAQRRRRAAAVRQPALGAASGRTGARDHHAGACAAAHSAFPRVADDRPRANRPGNLHSRGPALGRSVHARSRRLFRRARARCPHPRAADASSGIRPSAAAAGARHDRRPVPAARRRCVRTGQAGVPRGGLRAGRAAQGHREDGRRAALYRGVHQGRRGIAHGGDHRCDVQRRHSGEPARFAARAPRPARRSEGRGATGIDAGTRIRPRRAGRRVDRKRGYACQRNRPPGPGGIHLSGQRQDRANAISSSMR